MRKTKFLRKFLIRVIIVGILLVMNTLEVKATLQANPSTHYMKGDRSENWMKSFREMEMEGQAMGMSEILKEDLTPLSQSNNIDVHMMKSTEYGAIAILSASGYGNSSNDSLIESTTGDSTGIFLHPGRDAIQAVAGGLKDRIFVGIDKRYYDEYEADKDALDRTKRGDALGDALTYNPGCFKWHQSYYNEWVSVANSYFLRGLGVFSVGAYDGKRNLLSVVLLLVREA